MLKSEMTDLIIPALFEFQKEIDPVKKESDNPFFKSKYADLASIWAACKELLHKQGLMVMQPLSFDDGGVIVETIIFHSSGQWISSSVRGVPIKNDPQALGSLITYLRRYSLSAMLGLVTEDDDGNAASGKAPEKTESILEESGTSIIGVSVKKNPDGDTYFIKSRSQTYWTKQKTLAELAKNLSDNKSLVIIKHSGGKVMAIEPVE